MLSWAVLSVVGSPQSSLWCDTYWERSTWHILKMLNKHVQPCRCLKHKNIQICTWLLISQLNSKLIMLDDVDDGWGGDGGEEKKIIIKNVVQARLGSWLCNIWSCEIVQSYYVQTWHNVRDWNMILSLVTVFFYSVHYWVNLVYDPIAVTRQFPDFCRLWITCS